MKLTFKEDDTGCRCRLGEYRQMIKGFAEHDEGTGVMKPSHPLGMQLSRTQEQEDLREGVEPYGLRDNKLGNNENDSFTPVRDTGCLYKGKDEPGMRHIQPGDHVHFRFEFTGGPVDRRDRQRQIGRWSRWAVEGDYTFNPEPPDKPKDKPPHSDETKPRSYKGPLRGSGHFQYGGGIEEDPTIGDTYPVRLYFMSEGRQYHADIDMRVTRVTPKTVFLETVSHEPLNIAPQGSDPVIVPAGEKYIPLEDLKKPYFPMALDE